MKQKTKLLVFSLLSITLSYAQISETNQNNITVSNSTVSYGDQAGEQGTSNTFYGANAGNNTTANDNTFIGKSAGRYNTTGIRNTSVGGFTGQDNITGNYNTNVGHSAGRQNISGSFNTAVGIHSSYENETGSNNVALGVFSGHLNFSGSNNVSLGYKAGFKNLGSGGVFLGFEAGSLETEGNKLYIDNSNTVTPLIYGDFSTDILAVNGKLGIGTANPDDELTVNGTIHSKEVKVDLNIPADYVFEKYYNGKSKLKEDYIMPTLEEVEAYTKANHHLPEIPSAKDIKDNGLHLKEMTNLLLQKVEELTLYTIEQEKRIKALELELIKTKK